MADFKSKRRSILTFFAFVLFSTWTMLVFYGYFIKGRDLKVGIPVPPPTKQADLYLHVEPDVLVIPDAHVEPDVHAVPEIKETSSTIEEICQHSEVKKYYGNNSHPAETNAKYILFNATKVCYCAVPKAASTSLLRYLLMAEFPEKAQHYETIPGSAIHGQAHLRKSTPRACSAGSEISFFVTRDPYQRLFSAYIDKVFLEKYHSLAHKIKQPESSITVVKAFNETIVLSSKNKTQLCDLANATFGDFINHIFKTNSADRHFVPVTSLCNPCDHKFDLIMKQENMLHEMDILMGHLNSSRAISKTVTVSDYSGLDGIQRTATSFYTIAKKKCELTLAREDAIHRRLWDALKILGNIDDRQEFNSSWFGIPSHNSTATEIADLLVKRLEDSDVKALNHTQRNIQRQQHLIQAYRGVSDKLIQEIQRRFKLDFAVFGYDDEPPK